MRPATDEFGWLPVSSQPVTVEAASAATATTTSIALVLSAVDRWTERRAPHHLAWAVAFSAFATGSAALWLGAVLGWTQPVFKVFYLSGAILTVPLTALGSVHLSASERTARIARNIVTLFCAFSAGVMTAAPMSSPEDIDGLPRGSDVFGALPRVLAAVASGGGTLVIVATSTRAIVRALRSRFEGRSAVVGGNALVLAGVVTLSASGLLNSVLGEMTAFAVTLAAGALLLFAGFTTATRSGRGGQPRGASAPGVPNPAEPDA
ncbi:MAG: hypothetical protein KatS3mg008_1608 [Acidimicrobiales bacterium]|nr:MAG: hypothetical protein KatS3mg008_1608 [Acidimicrobiales bacterium]